MVLAGASPQGHHIRLSDTDIDRLLNRTKSDGVESEKSKNVVLPMRPDAWLYGIARMLDVRMLFSCLVDADYLDCRAPSG